MFTLVRNVLSYISIINNLHIVHFNSAKVYFLFMFLIQIGSLASLIHTYCTMRKGCRRPQMVFKDSPRGTAMGAAHQHYIGQRKSPSSANLPKRWGNTICLSRWKEWKTIPHCAFEQSQCCCCYCQHQWHQGLHIRFGDSPDPPWRPICYSLCSHFI